MRAKAGVTAIAVVAMLGLAACGGDKPPQLMNIRSDGNGPDEFGILPPKPLEMPETLADLPEPTPGGDNRTDPRPFDDASIALGRQAAAAAGGIPSGDARFTPMPGASASKPASARRWPPKIWNGAATTMAACWNGCST